MKKICTLLLLIAIYILPTTSVIAQENNKVGISLLQPTSEDIQKARALINGKNGEWGYITLVIQENDRDIRKWQDLFDQLRENHLIPIIRLATSPQGEVWRRPEEKDIYEWINFLNKLNWVIQKRYVVLFNEPNHASEWGGEVDPEGYAKVAYIFAKTLKDSSKDYVVMFAGLDAAAPSAPSQYEDSGIFIKHVFQTEPNLQNYIDAWASHSYPNPGFSGSVWDTGKKSIQGYKYELELLKEIGITKDLEVFITETGWVEGPLSGSQIADNYLIALRDIWGTDNRVRAVTPFVFKYLSHPFIGFSWVKEGGVSQQYTMVEELEKKKGMPIQVQKGTIEVDLPNTLVANSSYHFPLVIKNNGQGIWSNEDGFVISLQSSSDGIKTLIPTLQNIKPFEESQIFITLQTSSKPQTLTFSFSLQKDGVEITHTKNYIITIEPLPQLTVKTSLFPKFISQGEGFEIQLFNKREELVFSRKGLPLRNGIIEIERLSDIVPGETYRAVLLAYPYIPRQGILTLHKGKNTVSLRQMLPFDANGNGRIDGGDLAEAIKHPEFLLRFIPWRQD